MYADQVAVDILLDDFAFLEEVEEIVAVLEDDDVGFDAFDEVGDLFFSDFLVA